MPPLLLLAACHQGTEVTGVDRIVTSGRIVDTEQARVSEPMDLFIDDGRIVRVAPAGETSAAAGIDVIDATGMYLLPGLIDAHAHIGDGGLSDESPRDREQALAQFVRYGVTAIFVPGGGGGNDTQLNEWKAFCGRNVGQCPHLFGSGSIVTAYGSHPITTIWGMPADADPDVTRARGAVGITDADSVDRLLEDKVAAGVDAIKIVVEDGPGGFAPKPRLGAAKVAEICSKARAKGLRTFAHVSLAEHVVDVVDGGCDGIMHAPDDRIPEETLQSMADRGVFYVATLSLFDALMDQNAGRRSQDSYALAGVSQSAIASLENDAYWNMEPESPELIATWRQALAWNLTRADDLGIPIALGTDTSNPQIFPGYAVHEELELLVDTGLSEAKALHAATVTAARFLEQENDLGRVQEGFRADIIALRRNPLDDIRSTRAIAFVLMGGERIEDVVANP